MRKIQYGLIALALLICSVTSATAGVSIGIGLPTVSIGINLPVYPELVRVPGYPVYYAPQMDSNYFFYDGMYWVYQNDNWYASSWYNGPWGIVGPEVVPLYILRVPVSYYRQPPMYFRGWQSNAPPRWGQHWGPGWERQHSGWNRWNRGSAPAPAPLPAYQRQYSGDRYPRVEQQQTLRSQQYHYQPRDKVVRQHLQQVTPKAAAPAQQGRKQEPAMRTPQQQGTPRSAQPQQGGPAAQHAQPQRQGGENMHRQAPAQAAPQQRAPAGHEQRQQPAPAVHEQRQQPAPAQQHQQQPAPAQQNQQQAPRVNQQGQKPQERGEAQGGQGQGQRNEEEHGQGRGR
jgi:hypothetical protein